MTRGSVVIFSAVLSVKWLGRTLRQFHYWAIFFVIVAVVFVGLAGIEIGNSDSSSDDDCADDGDDGDDDGPAAGQVGSAILVVSLGPQQTCLMFFAFRTGRLSWASALSSWPSLSLLSSSSSKRSSCE